MIRRTLLGLLALAALPVQAQAEFAGLHKAAQAQMRFFGLLIYDVRLWVGEGFEPARWAEHRFALELEYARALKGSEIAKRSLDEMRRQGEIAPPQAAQWLAEMQAAFPDVKAGDRITGVHEPAIGARFYVNGLLSRQVNDPRFARLFFGIWLSPQTSEPALRERLLSLDARASR